MASKTATYKPKAGEGKARTREQADAAVWTAKDASQALSAGTARTSSPEAEDAFSPTPPNHHPEGKRMAARPPVQPSSTPHTDLWEEAEKLAVERRKKPGPPEDTEQSPTGEAASRLSESAPVPASPEKQVPGVLGTDPIVVTRMAEFLRGRKRVTLELQDGTFSMPIIHSIKGTYSITLIIPLDKNATTFVPKPGTELSMTLNGDTDSVYYPGAYAEIEPLTVAVMSFIRAESSK